MEVKESHTIPHLPQILEEYIEMMVWEYKRQLM